MLRYPEGTPCKLYYYTTEPIEPGHYVVSTGGSGYLVRVARRSQRNPYRYNLQCIRCNPNGIPPGATIHALHWFKRQAKPRGQKH